ncbi:HD domain-containing protein [Streptantibioticus ferralitis]|uniref:HD domain-containing protein n=1 Tax=Streptantibioticus ferralitis TaxID=236510 RepID=A0ABT5YZW3_9ACTN|nr:HD domain-containing protein [Streptantibioticus ferralitis]MDF2257141.1 HD domain-containing protein [Streptantibioticus ferralitis]
MDVTRARDLARRLLEEPLPRRWAHSQGVAAQAERLAPILGDDAELLQCAAWLHDIGYSPTIVKTGFHPLDGARYLRDVEHADRKLCNLVAHHSCALIEAEERSLDHELSEEFRVEDGELVDALIYCDMTTTPDGQETTAGERLAEILSRYGPEHVVTRSIERAAPQIRTAESAVRARLAGR